MLDGEPSLLQAPHYPNLRGLKGFCGVAYMSEGSGVRRTWSFAADILKTLETLPDLVDRGLP